MTLFDAAEDHTCARFGQSGKEADQGEMTMDDQRIIAYFSMEIGLDPEIPTCSGGLGILAGDTIVHD
jgi:glucan phosphorylase